MPVLLSSERPQKTRKVYIANAIRHCPPLQLFWLQLFPVPTVDVRLPEVPIQGPATGIELSSPQAKLRPWKKVLGCGRQWGGRSLIGQKGLRLVGKG